MPPNSFSALQSTVLRVSRVAAIQGELRPPSDKSLTHRAYMFGAIANGSSIVRNPLKGDDCEATLNCLQALGSTFSISGTVVGIDPPTNWKRPVKELDCGNSGTTMRLLSGLIASRPITATLTGDASLSTRPMRRIAEPLRLMGAEIQGESPPLTIRGADLSGIDYISPVASAQIKSCILLAGLRAEGRTSVTEPTKSRDHTERMLRACGVFVDEEGTRVSIDGGQSVNRFEFDVPADISSATFWMVAAAIVPQSQIMLRNVGVNPTRTGILDMLRQANVPFVLHDERESMGEPIADIEVRSAETGMPFEIDGDLVPRLIDEIPVLAVLATQLDGLSRIRGAKELRVKESDRIEAIAKGLRSMGAKVETREDGMDIEGPVRLKGAIIEANHDHRIAMAFAIAGLIAEGETQISGAETIASSYPNFEKDLWSVCVV